MTTLHIPCFAATATEGAPALSVADQLLNGDVLKGVRLSLGTTAISAAAEELLSPIRVQAYVCSSLPESVTAALAGVLLADVSVLPDVKQIWNPSNLPVRCSGRVEECIPMHFQTDGIFRYVALVITSDAGSYQGFAAVMIDR